MKTNTIFSVIACLAMVLFYSCVPDDAVPEHSGNPEELVFSSEHPYNLNVIYFVSNDREVNADYEQRISKIMLEGSVFCGLDGTLGLWFQNVRVAQG